MGLNAGSSVPDGGCSFTAMDCRSLKTLFFHSNNQLQRILFMFIAAADLWSGHLEVDVGDGDGGGRQHGDDHHQHVRPRRRRVPGKMEEDPQTVSIKHGYR